MTNTELRVATNNINVAGVVKEHKLEVKEGTYQSGDQKGKTYTYIQGKLVIKAGETKEISLSCRANQLTKQGKTNTTFDTLAGFINGTYPTMATDGVTEEEATKVSVWGKGDYAPQFSDIMVPDKGEIKEMVGFKLGFGRLNIKDNLAPEEYKAGFEVEMFVTNVEPEVKNQLPTGRTIVHGVVPMFGGTAMPLSIVAEDTMEDDGEVIPFAQQVLSGVYPNSTFIFWGDIRYERIESKITKGGTFGRAKTETEVTTVKEFVAIGGDIIAPDNSYTEDEIRQALAEREQQKQNRLAEEEQKQTKQVKGLGGITAPKPVAGVRPGVPTPPKPVAGATAPVKPVMPPKPTMATKVGF